MAVLSSKTIDGVLKGLYVFCIVYDLARIATVRAAKHQRVDVERISFSDALYWLVFASESEQLPRLVVRPLCSDRAESPVKKRRPNGQNHNAKVTLITPARTHHLLSRIPSVITLLNPK